MPYPISLPSRRPNSGNNGVSVSSPRSDSRFLLSRSSRRPALSLFLPSLVLQFTSHTFPTPPSRPAMQGLVRPSTRHEAARGIEPGALTPRHRVQRTWSRTVARRRPRWAVLPGDGGNVGLCRLETAETMEVRSPSRPLSPLPLDRPGRNSGNAGVASRSSSPVGLSRGRPSARCRHGRTRRRRPTRTKQPVPDEPARFGENHSPGQNHQIRTNGTATPCREPRIRGQNARSRFGRQKAGKTTETTE